MAVQIARHQINLQEYERMVEAGVFEPGTRVELVRGEIVDMAPIGLQHEACVARLTRLLGKLVGDSAIVWPQNNSIRLPNSNSRPQPDLTLLRWRDDDYSGKAPMPADVILVIEVSDTSLSYDRSVKAPLYAEAGIPALWIVNLPDKLIEVYSRPMGTRYSSIRKAGPGDSIDLPGGIAGKIDVSKILG